jgi:hypothetical protein
MAIVGESAKRYTRMGIVKMEPPPPINPIEIPISAEAI